MSQTEPLESPLNQWLGLISRIRRNHALEHATMHVLTESYQAGHLVGRSTPGGFFIYGEVPTERVLDASREALARLNAGQWRMAIHPRCGTNLVLAGLFAGLGSFLVLGGRSRSRLDRLRRLPLACAAATLGIILARPLGPVVQARISTDPSVRRVRILGLTRVRRAGILEHRIRTEA